MTTGGTSTALNRARFRAANDRIGRIARALGETAVPFLCECPDPRCTSPVTLDLDEYEAIRSSSDGFLVLRDHDRPGNDVNVIHAADRYAVVEVAREPLRLVSADRSGGQ